MASWIGDFFSGFLGSSDDTEIERLTKIADERGDVNAQYELGRRYAMGDGVAENDAEAVKWYEKAAVQGHVEAQFYLGTCYAYGNGVQKNISKAAKWLTMAAEEHHQGARKALQRLRN